MEGKERSDFIDSLSPELRIMFLQCQVEMLKNMLAELYPGHPQKIHDLYKKVEDGVLDYFRENIKATEEAHAAATEEYVRLVQQKNSV